MIRKTYNVAEALQIILEGASDSEMSDLEESDDDGTINIIDKVPERNISDEEDNGEDISFSINKEDVDVFIQDSAEATDKNCDHIYRWQTTEPPVINTDFLGNSFSLPPENTDELTPMDYFQFFWKSSLNNLISNQTNLYSVQKTGKSICTTSDEIEQLIGIQMCMSVIKLPSFCMYWAWAMSINRYKKLREFLHVNDNSKRDEDDNKNNKLFKIQPVLDHVRNNCLSVEPEIENSIDEQIIPAKTSFSGIRQYNPKKPVKWGFKNFVRSGASGMMYDFFLYSGSINKNEKCTGSYVVKKLIETLPKHQNFKLFFDNWFCSLPLCISLKDMGFLVTATIRNGRMKKCPLPTEKEFKKDGRGSHAFKTDANSGLVLTKWYDNKCVQMCSTYSDPTSVGVVRRWNRKDKKYIEISCPEVIMEYNQSMGGVDLSDMLIALYRTNFKTKRWYLKVLFHCVDIAKVNAWLLYRRYCTQLKVAKKQQLSLLKFTIAIASGLVNCRRIQKSVGRPSKRKSDDIVIPQPRKQPVAMPVADARYDNTSHWPEFREMKRKCRLCKTDQSRVYCMKCDLCLCMNNDRNCFLIFHTK